MAKSTFTVDVPANSWTPLSSGEGTVIVQPRQSRTVKIALAEASIDLGADDGHTLVGNSDSIGSATFTGLSGGLSVFARAEQAMQIVVTRY